MGKTRIAKNKQARREGVDLGLKTFGSKSQARLLKRLNILPGFKQVRKFSSKMTDYGRQLREKQKMKRIYGLSEKKLHHYFQQAVHEKGNSAENLIKHVERRIDNVLYRLHLAPTRSSARQLVSHGHLKVNQKKVTVPSFQVHLKDKIDLLEKINNIPYIKEFLDEKNYTLPNWLKRTGQTGEVIGQPTLEQYQEPVDLSLVIEFYSKL